MRAGRSTQDVGHRNRAGDAGAETDAVIGARHVVVCLLYTSDAADERSSVDLGGRRIIKKKKNIEVKRRGDIDHINHKHYTKKER